MLEGVTMQKLWRFLNRDLPFLSTVAMFLAAFIIVCRLNHQALTFFWSLEAILLASLIMLVYLAAAWKKLSKSDRWGIALSIAAWLVLFYSIVHAEGMTLMGYFLCYFG